MIDLGKLREILEVYKDIFPRRWQKEQYKWQAIKHFQDHWDIEAENFREMFNEATKKNVNLLESSYNYPALMIKNFAEAEDETVRQMFKNLFDESKDLVDRVNSFRTKSEELRVTYDDSTWRQHYQTTNAISTYLWLKYPDKYYIYKYGIYLDVSRELSSDYRPKADGSVETMIGGFGMYDEICEVLQQDEELNEIFENALTEDCYPDSQLKTLTVDFGHYLSNVYIKEIEVAEEESKWLHTDYSPGLSVQDWETLLKDESIITPESLRVLKQIKEHGGQATCKQLSLEYGKSYQHYSVQATKLAERIAKKTGCPLAVRESGDEKYWSILFHGKYTEDKANGNFIWRLRPELSEALEKVDFTELALNLGHEWNTDKTDDVIDSEEFPKYTKEDFLSVVYMDEERYGILESLLENKKNLILQGAPGVGKTFVAKKLAYAMMGELNDSRIEVVQFHQNYTYEDFIMGYRPDGAEFKLTHGIFYRFCQKAANNPEKSFFFIIDEINRGNLSKIFGELLMLIEKDYRGTKATLAYSGEPFSVPKNLYIIGMMNTADRSLAMIDYALRRRFSFFEIEPGFSTEGFMEYQNSLENETFKTLIKEIQNLNKEITEDKSLGKGFRIGHSYFCGRNKSDCTEDWMRSVVEFEILPMLSEYWFDENDKLQRWEERLRGVFDD